MIGKKYAQLLFIISLLLLLSLGYLYFFKISPQLINTPQITGNIILNYPQKEVTKSFSLASLTIFSFMLWLIVEKEG